MKSSVDEPHHDDELRRTRETLKRTEQKMQETLQKLRETSAELTRSHRDLEQYATIASHDMREPLRMVSLYLQLLRKHLEGKMDAQAKEYYGYVMDGADRLISLLDDLLKYTRTGCNARLFRVFDLSDSLDQAVNNIRALLTEAKAVIKVKNKLPDVFGDSAQLSQVFQNLIINAVKFRSDSIPVVEVGSRRENSYDLVFVKDNGIGIDPRFFSKLFQIFSRIQQQTPLQGAGVGLSVCKKIIETHCGEIWVESALGSGSTFYFTLPRNVPPNKLLSIAQRGVT